MPRSEKFGICQQKQLELTAFCRRAAFRRLKSIVFIYHSRDKKVLEKKSKPEVGHPVNV
jgi:hypothetical protein